MDNFSLEHHFKLFNNELGSYLKIGPDRDGLGAIESSHSENDFSILLLHLEEAKLLIDALAMTINDLNIIINEETND